MFIAKPMYSVYTIYVCNMADLFIEKIVVEQIRQQDHLMKKTSQPPTALSTASSTTIFFIVGPYNTICCQLKSAEVITVFVCF